MNRFRILMSATTAAALLSFVAPAASSFAKEQEPASVVIKLWNKDDGTMGVTLDKTTIAPGPVEFDIKNMSKNMMHEALIAPWSGDLKALPYDDGNAFVKENAIPDLQGQEDMKPGTETTLRLTLKPGSYIVFCNQPGHYKMGMYARFTVGSSS